MAGRVRALLVGIDDYLPPVTPLAGCGNDVAAMERVLRTLAGDRLDAVVVRDREATRERIVAAFRDHLVPAGPEDVALFYYSGHGSQEPAAEEFWGIEADRLDETLVCVDSRTPGRHDLADKELAVLVEEASRGGGHVVLILDCCHSGSGVRGREDVAGQVVRQVAPDTRVRPLSSYAVTVPVPQARGASTEDAVDRPGAGSRRAGTVRALASVAPTSRYVLLAACESRQTAKEQPIAGIRRGVFTASLETALYAAGGNIAYGDLLSWVTTRVKGLAAAQVPQLEVVEPSDRSRAFLGGGLAGSAHFVLARDTDGWAVSAGRLHGVPHPSDGQETAFAVHEVGTPSEAGAAGAPVGTAVVTRVEAARSLVDVRPAAPEGLDPARPYAAVPLSWPVSPTPVAVTGDPVAAALVRDALAAGGSDVQVAEPDDDGVELVVTTTGSGFELRRASDGRPATAQVAGHTGAAAAEVARQVRHVARWRRLRDLANPTSRMGGDRLGVDVVPEGAAAPVVGQVELHQDADGRHQPGVVVTVTNRGPGPVFVGVLGLSSQFGVVNLMAPSSGQWVPPGQDLPVNDGLPIRLEVADGLHRSGVTEVTDYLTVLASTDAFDAGTLTQPELDAPGARDAAQHGAPAGLGGLTRGFAASGAAATPDWNAWTRAIVTRRPAPGVPFGGGGGGGGGGADGDRGSGGDGAVRVGALLLSPPPGVSGTARIAGVDTASRDVPVPVPAALRPPEVSAPVPLAPTRGPGDDASVLELVEVRGADAVTPATPLVVRVPQPTAADESVLAVAWDGTYWLPVGCTAARNGDSTDVAIVQLPAAPGADEDERGLGSATTLLFRKLVGRRLGLDYPWPRLAVATADESGEVRYDVEGVADAVAAARSVLLYVHGIIGDTRGQVRDGARSGLHAGYDVVLAFDYENLHTTIEENARSLEDALLAAGLDPGKGTRLDVVAHSMGGLVSRWFIEHGRGREMVDRLVLAGTPSAGSPWPQVQDWATAALGLGLNGLGASPAWPVAVVGGLVALVERVDNSLDQMHATSGFLSALAALGDPGVPYTVLCGDRSVPPDDATQSLLGRLRMRATDAVSALAFFGEPNDIAVTVASATSVPSTRSPAPAVVRTGCDHMTYFSSTRGRDAIARALAGAATTGDGAVT